MEAVRDRGAAGSRCIASVPRGPRSRPAGLRRRGTNRSTIDPTVVLGEGVLRLLRSVGGSGTLLLLEDLHWADPDTVALLDYLGGTLSTSPIIVAATVRDDSPGSWVARDLARIPGAIHVRLGQISYADATVMVEQSRPDLAEAQRQLIITRAEGVPLVLEELLTGTSDSSESVAATVPESFAELVHARLGLLTDEQRRVLSALALIGGEPDWSLAAAVTDLHEQSVWSAARAAAEAHLLVAEENRLRWRHALTREAVAAAVLPPERSALAVRAARALLARGGEDDESAAADLLAAAGDRGAAAEIRLRQVGRDMTKGAMRSAEQRLDQLAEEAVLPVQVAMERVRLYTLIGDASRALEVGATALDLSTGDDHAELCLWLARAAIIARRWKETEEYVGQAGGQTTRDPQCCSLRLLTGPDGSMSPRSREPCDRAVRADQHPEVLCEALCIVGRLAGSAIPPPPRLRSAGPVRSPRSSGFVRGAWRPNLGLGTAEALDQELSARLVSARDLALDSGLLMQAGGAEVILAEQAYVTNGPRAPRSDRHSECSSLAQSSSRRISLASAIFS